MSIRSTTEALMKRLQESGAPRLDPVGWHYIETLARRSEGLTGPAQALLCEKLLQTLQAFEQREASVQTGSSAAVVAPPSALALLLKEMAPPTLPTQEVASASRLGPGHESPRVRQFRQQLRQISVHKRVSKAIAKAPTNAGPINSHMLVLRALGLMRDISPDYLNRFMTHVDTLMCLQASEQSRPISPRGSGPRTKK